jgi:hypothetical protein
MANWRILRREIVALNLQKAIAEQVAKLSPQRQEQVLIFVSSLGTPAPKGESGAALTRFAGSIDAVSAREMTQAIEAECERVDAEQWRAFQTDLDAPPPPAPRLAKLLSEPSVFDRGGLE